MKIGLKRVLPGSIGSCTCIRLDAGIDFASIEYPPSLPTSLKKVEPHTKVKKTIFRTNYNRKAYRFVSKRHHIHNWTEKYVRSRTKEPKKRKKIKTIRWWRRWAFVWRFLAWKMRNSIHSIVQKKLRTRIKWYYTKSSMHSSSAEKKKKKKRIKSSSSHASTGMRRDSYTWNDFSRQKNKIKKQKQKQKNKQK